MDENDWVSTWKEHASAFDRVRSVVMAIDQARSVQWIAERARVAESTARDHLERLAEMGVVTVEDREGKARYGPDPAYVRFQEIRELTSNHDTETLGTFIVDLKESIEALQTRYNEPSPQALRKAAAAEDIPSEKARELLRAAADWEHYSYRLSLLEDAVARYDEYAGKAPA